MELALIVVGILVYMILGYVIGVIIMAVTDGDFFDDCENQLVPIILLWPFILIFYGFLLLVKITWCFVEFIGKRLAIIPATIAVAIKTLVWNDEE